jgi:biotin synthase-related radical SAM superfamily protein
MNKKIGIIRKEIINILQLNINENTPIIIGEANIEHIKTNHLEDYKKYGNQIVDILENPTYVARDKRKNSIEFIKKFTLDDEMVLVVVKASR